MLAEDVELVDIIKTSLARQPFQLICQRLLHHFDDACLLDFLSGILGKSYSEHRIQQLLAATDDPSQPSSTDSVAQALSCLEQYLQCLIFGCVTWRSLDSLLMHVAMAFHFQELYRRWQESDQVQVRISAALYQAQSPCMRL